MERLNMEYPGFHYSNKKNNKIDTPTLEVLNTCIEYKGSYGSTLGDKVYITIDDYIDGSQIIKEMPLYSFRAKIARMTILEYFYLLYESIVVLSYLSLAGTVGILLFYTLPNSPQLKNLSNPEIQRENTDSFRPDAELKANKLPAMIVPKHIEITTKC